MRLHWLLMVFLLAACEQTAEEAARSIALKECDCFKQRQQQKDDASCKKELEDLYADFAENYRFGPQDSARVQSVHTVVRQALIDCGATQ
ncbi:MAG: hypothetical protein KF690_11225 [Bacteroidetes bacterium]|nr:hypothetical protein [Bacteroidota bacterium]